MKRTFGLFMAVLLMIASISLPGCTGQKSAVNSGDAKKVKVITWEKPNAEQTQEVKAMYEDRMMRVREKFPNIEIVEIPNQSMTDYRQAYDKALMAGEGPTYFSEFSYTDIPTRIKNGTVAEITEFVLNWDMKKEDKVINTFDEAISSNGKWYAIPKSGYVQATMYNKKALKAGGGNPEDLPETWDEFTALGQKITDFSIPRVGYELVGMDWNAWPFTAWVWSAGGEMVRPNGDGTYKIAFNEDPGVDTAMLLNSMVWKYKMTQKDVLQEMSKIMEDIRAGRACFSWDQPGNFARKDLETYNLTLDDLGIIPMPVKDKSIKRPALAGGEVYTFNPRATKEEIKAAFDIISFMSYDEEELIRQWSDKGAQSSFDSKIPARKDLLQKNLELKSYLPQKMRDELSLISANAKAEPFCPNWSDLKSTLVNPLQKIFLSENLTREQAKKILDDCANELYKRYPNSFRAN